MTQSPIAKRAANDEATLRKRIASIIKQEYVSPKNALLGFPVIEIDMV